MAAHNFAYQIGNPHDSSKPFTFININNTVKLNPLNYLSWKLQLQAILIGHDLLRFVDGTTATPTVTTISDGAEISNPDYVAWLRQDQLLFEALIGTLSPSLHPLVSRATTSPELWETLAKTYATPTRGHIKQLKNQFNKVTKGNRTITDYLHSLKAISDQLASLGKPIEHEDFVEKILDGLDSNYKSIKDTVNGRDTTISFEELHEKLITCVTVRLK